MKKFILLLSFAFSSAIAFSQIEPATPRIAKTSFYAELGGPGILFSANIDTRFKNSHLGLGGRIGIGFVTADESKYDPNTGYTYNLASVVTVPAQVNYIFGKDDSPHTFEVGAGLTYVGRKLDIMEFYDSKKTNVFGTFAFMYRRQPIDGGFTWRAGFTPLVAQGYIQPFGALGVGFNF
jgi:hypothetical protein